MAAKPTHRYKQSGVIPYRRKKGRIQILLISNRRRTRWVIPKGMSARRMDERTSATKEALEEAGVIGMVSVRRIGRYTYEKWGGRCIVTVFLMRVDVVHDKWAERDRRRTWVGISKAQRMVDEKKLRKLISKVPHLVSSGLAKLKKVDGYK